jgi:hypothetical protein
MFWRLHKAVFNQKIEEATNIIKSFGDTFQVVSGTPLELAEVPFEKINEPALAITTLQDAQRLIRKDYPSTPWLFFNNKDYKVSYWLPRIGFNIPVLNREALFIPTGMLRTIKLKQLEAIVPRGEKLFIKPDSGNKVFTGFSLKNDETFFEELENNFMFTRPEPEEMCVISAHKDIEDIEWRFWIAEREVIAYSPYSWEGEPEFSEPPEDILKMAQLMAKNKWQPDYIYVADFCTTTTGEVMLIEINAASTSGIYDAPLNKLLPLIRNTCIREYNGEIDFINY